MCLLVMNYTFVLIRQYNKCVYASAKFHLQGFGFFQRVKLAQLSTGGQVLMADGNHAPGGKWG